MAARSASASSPATAVETSVADLGELQVTHGVGKEGLYFNAKSKLIQKLFSQPIQSIKRRSAFLQTPFWAKNGHVSTVLAHMFRASSKGHPGEGYDRMLLNTRDGGTLSVDVTKTSKKKSAEGGENTSLKLHQNPFVLMVAGLGGSSTDPYTQAMTSACAKRGWKSAVVCMRGTGNGPVTSGRLFSARRGSTEDVRYTIAQLKSKGIIEEEQPIVGIGWSLGGCIMNNTILEQDEMVNPEARLDAVAALGAPYSLHHSSEVLKPFPNWIYSKRMAQGLVNILKPVAHNFEGVKHNFLGKETFNFDPEKIYSSQSIKEFDEHLTAPFFGFGSAREYYDYSSPGPRFSAQTPSVPTIIVSALDDPVVGNQGIPYEAARKNPNMLVVATSYGGHLGWCEGADKGCGYAQDPSQTSWTEDLVLDFFKHSLQHKHDEDKTNNVQACNQ